MDVQSDQGNARFGRGMLWLAAFALLGLLTLAFQALTPKPGGVIGSVVNGSAASVVLRRDPSGHYLAEGVINGQPVPFIVDTGATDVAVSEALARRLGLEFGPRVTVMTAAGPAQAWATRVDSVSLGDLSVSNVRAMISPALGPGALLGMSFLKHFSLRQEGDLLIISGVTETGGEA